MEAKEITKALDNGVQPILYFNPCNAKCRVIAYEQHDPDGAALFTAEVEGHGTYSGISILELFDDREPAFNDEPNLPATTWAWTQEASVEAITDQVKESVISDE